MYRSSPQTPAEEDYFANINYSKNIDCIIPTTELLVNFKINGLRAKKACLVYAEKMDFKGLIQIRMIEKCDQRRMYITTIDSAFFPELKLEQSLHVTFGGFIENLIKLLQECQTGKLEIYIVQAIELGRMHGSTNGSDMTQNTEDYQLQFVETRTFKNLVHLSLPCRMASINVVMFYMNNIMDAMQKKIMEQDHLVQQLQQEVTAQMRRSDQIAAESAKMQDNFMENTRKLTKRHAEEIEQLEENLKRNVDQRQSDNERNRKTIASLQAQVDKLGIEKAKIQNEKGQEQKRYGALNDELNSLKQHSQAVREQNEKLTGELSQLKANERKHDTHVNELKKHIGELQEKIRKHEKSKADLAAELEAEKKISQTKRHALQMATEEITKANEIIVKQSQEICKLKKTVAWRTEIALQQEKAITDKESQLNNKNEEIQLLHQTVQSLRKEVPEQLMSMRAFANSLESKYSEQIKALREKLEGNENEISTTCAPRVLASGKRK